MNEHQIFNLAYTIFEQCKKAKHDQLIKVVCDIEKNRAIIMKVRYTSFTKYYTPIDCNKFIMHFESGDALDTIYRRLEHRITG